ncbi:unnamed protein product, partial [Heterosigma akashiwo]
MMTSNSLLSLVSRMDDFFLESYFPKYASAATDDRDNIEELGQSVMSQQLAQDNSSSSRSAQGVNNS